MDRLPPELLGYILDIAVPRASPTHFRERHKLLRSFSLVNRNFRREAQRLLFDAPFIYINTPDSDDPATVAPIYSLGASLSKMAKIASELSVTWFQFLGCDDPLGPPLEWLLQQNSMQQLRYLALDGIVVDENLLVGPKNLEVLLLCDVDFSERTADRHFTLTRLKHLTLYTSHTNLPESMRLLNLPPCLFPSNLPRLTATSHYQCRASYTLDLLEYLRTQSGDQLQLLSLQDEDVERLLRNNQSVLADFTALVHRTLVDVSLSLLLYHYHYRPDEQPSLISSIWRHLRIYDSHDTLYPAVNFFVHEENWALLWEVVLHRSFPDLETLVIPSTWDDLSIEDYEFIESFSQRHKVLILEEEEDWRSTEANLDGQLSRVFMRHRNIK